MKKLISIILVLSMTIGLIACSSSKADRSQNAEESEIIEDTQISKEDIYGVWTFETTYIPDRDGGISGAEGDSVTYTIEFYEGDTGKYDVLNNTTTFGHSCKYFEWSIEDGFIKLYFNGNATSTFALRIEGSGEELTLVRTSNTDFVYTRE